VIDRLVAKSPTAHHEDTKLTKDTNKTKEIFVIFVAFVTS
jgi:hypothetical protein